MFTSSKAIGIIEYQFTNKDGVKLYDGKIETIIYDHSPRNPSLPVVDYTYGKEGKPTVVYHKTIDEIKNHFKSLGFQGEIVMR